jgi:hypothetical protein
VRLLIDRFPYYDRNAPSTALEDVVRDLTEIVERIDSPARLEGRFWATFVDDVGMGDFATEDVLAGAGDTSSMGSRID